MKFIYGSAGPNGGKLDIAALHQLQKLVNDLDALRRLG
jgi:hypothetical protein